MIKNAQIVYQELNMTGLTSDVDNLPGRMLRQPIELAPEEPKCDLDLQKMWSTGVRPTADQVAKVLERHASIKSGIIWDWMGDILENAIVTDAQGWAIIKEAAQSGIKTMLGLHRVSHTLHFYVEPFQKIAQFAEERAWRTNAATRGEAADNFEDLKL